jgi:hypothetical protein
MTWEGIFICLTAGIVFMHVWGWVIEVLADG